jgi:hypothetical protein
LNSIIAALLFVSTCVRIRRFVAAVGAFPSSDNTAWFAQTMNYWYSAMRPFFAFNGAPGSLDQSILPWTFAGLVVNENNSSNPAAEQAVVRKDSYGRQLGRISDALEFLIARLPEPDKKDNAIQTFVEMKAQIDEIKRAADAARFDRVLSWLEDLSRRDEKTFTKRLASINALAKK